MPTTKPRHQITETDRVARALSVAAQRWPEDRNKPSRLLVRLIETGADSIDADVSDAREDRRRRILELAGSMPGVDQSGTLHELRAEWPE